MWDGIAGSCWMPKQKTKTNTVCNIYYMDIFARHLCKGGIYHINQHIAGIKRNVKSCPTATGEEISNL